jgi:hypothetical protein
MVTTRKMADIRIRLVSRGPAVSRYHCGHTERICGYKKPGPEFDGPEKEDMEKRHCKGNLTFI